jgi:integrase
MQARKPWYRASKDAWYVEIDGKQIRLAAGKANKAQAETAFYRLMAGSTLPTNLNASPAMLTATLCDMFLDQSQVNNKDSTYQWHKYFLARFVKVCGQLPATTIKPFHITRWIDSNRGWTGAKRSAIAIVQRVFSWAKSEGLLAENALAGIKKPPIRRRERIVSAADKAFRDFLFALQHTGCRPSEIAKVTAANVDLNLGLWIFQEHKTSAKTGRPRVIYLTPELLELTKQLVAENPQGPIFRNRLGKAFSKNAIRCRFRRIRDRLPHLEGVVAYSYRHAFATDALIQGVGIAQVAELMGHTSTEMVSRVYGHIASNVSHLRDAAVKATRQANCNSGKPPATGLNAEAG